MDPEELKRIVEASRRVHDNTKRGEPRWIWKGRQMGFERYKAGMLFRYMFEVMFGPQKLDVLDLAIKITKGRKDFTAEELQLQANEAELLEEMLKELRE